MLDAINGDDDSDRLLVRWRLRDPAGRRGLRGRPHAGAVADELAAGATVGLGVSDDGAPEPGDLDGATVLVAVPPRHRGAAADRPGARRALAGRGARGARSRCSADGGRIDGFDRDRLVRRRGGTDEARPGSSCAASRCRWSSPFRTSFGTADRARRPAASGSVTDEAEGWGECVAMSDPLYSSEYVDAAADVLRRFLVPGARRGGRPIDAHAVAGAAGAVQGPPDGQGGAGDGASSTPSCAPRADRSRASSARSATGCRAGCRSASWTSIPALLDAVGGYLDEGYVRIKLKIEPGWDVEPVRAVRERFGDDVLLQVDANTAYTLADARHLARLDPFDLLLIEQPLAEDDMLGHADLARLIRTPDLPRRVDRLGAVRRGRDRARRLPDRQHQARPGRRLPRGAADPRRLRGARRPGVVRRHARDRARPGRQRRPGRAARLHAARRHVGVGPLLPHRHHRRRSCSTTAT